MRGGTHPHCRVEPRWARICQSQRSLAVPSRALPSPAERSRGRPFGVGHGLAWWDTVAAWYGMAKLGNFWQVMVWYLHRVLGKPGGARRPKHANKSLARRGVATLLPRFPSCVFPPCPFSREGNHQFPKRGMWFGGGVGEWWQLFWGKRFQRPDQCRFQGPSTCILQPC